MTGPEHYANAESDLEHAAHASDRGRLDDMAYWLQCAQVHATLAAAAATALTSSKYTPVQADMTEWRMAAGNQTAAERDQMGGRP